MTALERVSEQVTGASIVSLDIDEDEQVFTLVLSNGLCLYLVGGLGISKVDMEKLH